MADRDVELSEQERDCLAHLRRSQELKVDLSQYRRERELEFHQLMR